MTLFMLKMSATEEKAFKLKKTAGMPVKSNGYKQ